MKAPVRNFIIRDGTGTRDAETLVIGKGMAISTTAGGLPELEATVGESQLMPSGGDDTQAIRDALARSGRVRLGPGDFNVSGQIDVGTGESLAGCGPARTRLLANVSAPISAVVRLTGSGAAAEGFRVRGTGAESCIRADSASGVRLYDLRLNSAFYGMRAVAVQRGEISRVFVEDAVSTGVYANGEQLVISNLRVESCGGAALWLAYVYGAACTGLSLINNLVAMKAEGSSLSFTSVVLAEAVHGLEIANASGVSVSGLLTRDIQEVAVKVTGSSAVALAGCAIERSNTALHVGSSSAVTVDGMTVVVGTNTSGPDVVVGSGSTLVKVAGITRANPHGYAPPPYQVDVAGAGGRVVFIQHGFDPARINSGGNFAAL